MRRALTTLIAASLLVPALAPTTAFADPDHDRGRWHEDGRHDRGQHRGWGDHERHDGPPPGWRQYRRGEHFERDRAWRYADIDYRYYRLRPPPRGYHWVRNGNDALLVGIATGVVASVMLGIAR